MEKGKNKKLESIKKPESMTMRDNYQQAALRKERLYVLLDTLETQDLSPEEHERICTEAEHYIQELREEREQMILYMAGETVFLDEAETRLKEIMRVTRKRAKKHIMNPAPTNAQIDAAEKRMRHFAQGKSFYKLFWVFFIGCFAGVIVERIWCFIRNGTIEPRVALIYGPFNPVYGIGAWALTLALYPFRNRSKFLSFLGGMVIGSVVEYVCSFVQEMLTGSVSWDYSHLPFNLNGRICLLYSIYWGVLGVIWIKELYPRLAKAILKIPNKIGKPLTMGLVVFMVFDCVMSSLCVLRWMERREGVPPSNGLEAYFDEHYPDERMQALYSNLVFNDEDEKADADALEEAASPDAQADADVPDESSAPIAPAA